VIYQIKKRIRELSHTNRTFALLYSLANLCKVKLLMGLSDETYAKIKYKENTGKTLNLTDPRTFNEKLWWLKVHNRDPLLTTCTDKLLVRKYVEGLGLGHILTNLYGVYDDAKKIDFGSLPDKVFFKTNHASGKNAVFDRNKPFDQKKFEKEFNFALRQNYYWQSREWNYKDIKPLILAEQFLESERLVDYKFLCFDGEPRLLFVETDIAREDGTHNPKGKRNVYDMNYNLIEGLRIGRDNFDASVLEKPKNFETMIKYAEMLSHPFPHCRVDLYNIKGRIYFGEITFYHGGATQEITPEEWDERLGSWIDLNNNKIIKVTPE